MLLLLSYEEDATPACTTELASFRDDFEILAGLAVDVLAVSTDSLASHHAFLERIGGLPFPLLSDTGGVLARALETWDPATRRSKRAVFVSGSGGAILHAACPYNPSNLAQYEAVFRALGFQA
jgi:peroxiredoxin Q/BCP